MQTSTFLSNAAWIIEAVIAIALGIAFNFALQSFLKRVRPRFVKSVDAGVFQVVSRLLTIAILVLTAMIVLQIIGINILPILTFGGIGAAALAFAGKDVLANFFGGVMLYITRSFSVGDDILIPERSIEGKVEEIGWYFTSLRDKEKRPLYLPNSLFSTLMVVNASRMTHRKIHETFKIRWSDISKVQMIVDKIKKELASDPTIDKNVPILCYFDTVSEYALNVFVDVYTLATRMEEYVAVKQDLLIRIQNIISSCEAEIAFPTYKYV